jgi:HAD superfamily hydrolase (TIGR01549 family)
MRIVPEYTRRNVPSGIIFDLDGTLFDREGALLAWSLGRITTDIDELLRARILRIARSSPTRGIFLKRVNPLFTMPAARDELDTTLDTFITPNEALRTSLRGVQARMPMALLSNGDGALQRRKLRACGLDELFRERVFISGETGCIKPDPRAFEAARASLGVPAQETLMIGNHPRLDIKPAKRLGYQTALAEGPNEVACLLERML